MSNPDQHVTSESISNEKENSMPLCFKWGLKFPLGDDTHVTVRASDTQPIIEISSYEQLKTSSGHHVVIPKHLGVMLTPKQFTQLTKSGPLIRSVIKSFTKPKLKSSARCSKCVIRQVKRKIPTAKDKVDSKRKNSLEDIFSKSRRGPLSKRNQSCESKKNACTQTEVKKSEAEEKSLMKTFTGVQKTIEPFVC